MLLVGFVGLILAEIAVFAALGGVIGVWGTLALVVASAALGVAIVRAEGRGVMQALVAGAREGRGARLAVGDSVAKAAAGVLLILPGVLTDLAGLALLVPPVRALVLRRIGAQGAAARHAATDIIEGQAVEVDMGAGPARPGLSGRPQGDRKD